MHAVSTEGPRVRVCECMENQIKLHAAARGLQRMQLCNAWQDTWPVHVIVSVFEEEKNQNIFLQTFVCEVLVC